MPVWCDGLQCLVLGIKTTPQRLYFLKSTGDFLKLQQETPRLNNTVIKSLIYHPFYKSDI